MRVTATVSSVDEGGARRYIAECVELDMLGEGTSPDLAVQALRKALLDKLTHPEAIGPPESTPTAEVEVVVTDGPSGQPFDKLD